MRKKTFAVVVVLYNPDDNELKRILSYVDVFDYVFVYDNSEETKKTLMYERIKERTIYYTENANNGLSRAYNHFLKKCKDEKIDFLCTMDQDSVFNSENILKIKRYILENDLSNVGIIAPLTIWQGNKNIVPSHEVVEETWVISSGSFINVPLIGDLFFDEGFFIDALDKDFCLRLRKKGMKVIMCRYSILEQKMGEEDKKHPNHSPIRHYYMVRNNLYLNNKIFSKNTLKRKNKDFIFRHLLSILLFEGDKRKKFKAVRLAIADYKIGKTGKFDKEL